MVSPYDWMTMDHDRWPSTWAPYMTWAKHHPPARYDLTGSNLLHCNLDDLPRGRQRVELTGSSDEGYPPLVEAIARRYGASEERVAIGNGAAGATFLAMPRWSARAMAGRPRAIVVTNLHNPSGVYTDPWELMELDWFAPASGASIGFPRLIGVDDSGPFVEMARRRFGVGMVPGRFFGAPAHFRASVAGKKRVLEDGLEALSKALDEGWS